MEDEKQTCLNCVFLHWHSLDTFGNLRLIDEVERKALGKKKYSDIFHIGYPLKCEFNFFPVKDFSILKTPHPPNMALHGDKRKELDELLALERKTCSWLKYKSGATIETGKRLLQDKIKREQNEKNENFR